VSWNYTTFLNIAFLLLAAALVVRFLRTGGRAMLAMMGGSPDTGHTDSHGQLHGEDQHNTHAPHPHHGDHPEGHQH
jgi:hypothetical protein